MNNALLDRAVEHALEIRKKKSNELLAEALDNMMRSNPPVYGRTWTLCLRIKRYLKKENL